MTTLTRAQVREFDRRAIEEFGVPGIVLMENAGRGAAELLMRLNPERAPVVVVCGKGNNGGDGFVIARHLDLHGWPVSVWPLAAAADLRGDAAVHYEIVRRAGLPWLESPCPVNEKSLGELRLFGGWIVDAMFGTGLTGPLGDPFDRVVSAINESPASVLAVDIPSGLDCDSGEPLGPTVRADHTVTFVAAKSGFANPAARPLIGEVHVAQIGAPRRLMREFGLAEAIEQ